MGSAAAVGAVGVFRRDEAELLMLFVLSFADAEDKWDSDKLLLKSGELMLFDRKNGNQIPRPTTIQLIYTQKTILFLNIYMMLVLT